MAFSSIIAGLLSFVAGNRLIDGGDCLALAQATASASGGSGLTALAGGAQVVSPGNGNLCQFAVNEFTTVASGNDSAVLQFAIAGASITVINDGGATLAVFARPDNNPVTGAKDQIIPVGTGTPNANNVAIAITVGTGAMIFECPRTGFWKQTK